MRNISMIFDPLRSARQAYAEKLKSAGVPGTYKLYTGVIHEFVGLGAVLDEGTKR